MLRISPYQANRILDSYRIGRLKVFIELFPLDHSSVSDPDNIVAFGLIGHIPQLSHADTAICGSFFKANGNALPNRNEIFFFCSRHLFRLLVFPEIGHIFTSVSELVPSPVVFLRFEKRLTDRIIEMLDSFHVDARGQHQVADFDGSKVFVFFSPRSIEEGLLHHTTIDSLIDSCVGIQPLI